MQMSRRRMLTLSLGGGVLLSAGVGTLSSMRQPSRQPGFVEVIRKGRGLGTDLSLTLIARSTSAGEQAIDAAFAEIETVEQVMSLYRPDSQICQLNRERLLKNPHPYLREVLATAASISSLSEGAFDITVQPLWNVYAECQMAASMPSQEIVDAARRSIGWQSVELEKDSVRLNQPVEAITLNGIAQGFATDRAIAALRQAGIQQALINVGELGSLGGKADEKPWVAGIQHPRQPDAYAEVIALDGRCLATSGDYATTFSADFSRNHIFDPRTGDSPRELASVSIVAPNGMLADGLSTAAMVLGAEPTLALVERIPDVDALLILKSGKTLQSAGFPKSAVL